MSSKAWHTDRCWFAGTGSVPCSGQLQRAHFLPKTRLKAHGIREFDDVWDPDVWTPMCERHHARFDAGLETVTRDQLPSAVFRYAERHGIEWMISRDYA